MRKFELVDLGALVLGLLALGYFMWAYQTLPETVPVHYGINGLPNQWGPKNELFIIESILAGSSFIAYLLMKFLPSIDPKRQGKSDNRTFMKLGFGIVIFMAALNVAITYSTINQVFSISLLIMPLVGLFFVFLGNVMYSIRPNYFAGIRTPWTLEDEANWTATHHVTSTVWVMGGIVITLFRLFWNSPLDTYVFLICIGIMSFTPMIYSYVYFKKHQVK